MYHSIKNSHTLKFCILSMFFLLLSACGGYVKYAPQNVDATRKAFQIPQNEKSALFIYRDGFLGSKVNTEVFLDGKILGKNLGYTYLYAEVPQGEHKITSHLGGYTNLAINVEPNKIYYVKEEIDTGMFETKIFLYLVDEATGQSGVRKCKLVETAQ